MFSSLNILKFKVTLYFSLLCSMCLVCSFLSFYNKLFVFNHCSIFRSGDDECIFSRKLILKYINEEMRFNLLLLKIYIIIPKCACVCLSVCLFVHVLFENG